MSKDYELEDDKLDWEVENSDFENEELEEDLEEEENYVKIIDIEEDFEEDVDISDLAETSITLDEIEEELPNTLDLKSGLGSLNLHKKQKIKLNKINNKKPRLEGIKKPNFLEKNFKNNDYNLSTYNPEEDIFTDDFRDLGNINNTQKTKHELDFDIKKAEIWLFNHAFFSIKNFIKNIKFNKLNNSEKNNNFNIQNKYIKWWIISTISLFIVFILGIFYIKTLESNLKTGFEKLASISNHYNYNDIKKINKEARWNFAVSSIMLFPLDLMFNNPIFKNKQYALISNINAGAKDLTSATQKGFELFEGTQKLIEQKWVDNIYYTQILHNSKKDIDYINTRLKSSFKAFNEAKKIIDSWKIKIPENITQKFNLAYSQIEIISDFSNKIFDNYEAFLNILWDNKAKNYLVVFQNSDEIRPTWWFMWSMWIITIFKWKITNFERKDVYAYEWDLKPFTKKAPKWINKISDTFGLRDANYYVNFKESSEEIKSHFDKLNKPLDGIIYLNVNSLDKFFDETWSIKIPNLNIDLTSENFSSVMSLLVESKLSKQGTLGTPKQVLFDFMNIFTKKLKEKWSYFTYIKIAWELIKNREIVFYPFDKQAQKLAYNLNINWNIDYNSLDHNYVVNTSISGNKSDRYIERIYKKEVVKNQDCSIDTNLEITHKHNFNINNELKFKKLLYQLEIPASKTEKLLFIQWKGDNYDYVRVLLPKDVKVKWEFNTKKVGNYTQVDFYLKTPVNQEKSINLEYTIPNVECKNYNYSFYKQPWIKNYNFELKNWQEEILLQNQITDFKYK